MQCSTLFRKHPSSPLTNGDACTSGCGTRLVRLGQPRKGTRRKINNPPKRRKTERPSDHICCRRRPQTTLRFIGSLSKLTSTFVTFVTVFSNLHKHTSTMSGVVGIDFGYQTCLIAAAGRGGVDVVLNGSSNRQNPYVSIYLSIVVLYC
jgi:hypothetical protein